MSRKQQIENFLNGITSTELDTYVKEHNLINKDKFKNIELIKRHTTNTHIESLYKNPNNKINEGIEDYVLIAEAQIIGILLNCFYDEKYTIADIKTYFKSLLDGNKKLKEYVYEYMKDLK